MKGEIIYGILSQGGQMTAEMIRSWVESQVRPPEVVGPTSNLADRHALKAAYEKRLRKAAAKDAQRNQSAR
jgi:pyrroline-5-carboxylate reductase